MKNPLRFQNTEYDCATTTLINALSYLYEREEAPVELLKAIYSYTLDESNQEGIIGMGGTSKKNIEKLIEYFQKYAIENHFDLSCEILKGEKVSLKVIKEAIKNNKIIVALCWQEEKHYVLITNIDKKYVYLFDPYYFEKNYYDNDPNISIVLHQDFTHNRLVKKERLFDESGKDFSLPKRKDRFIIIMGRNI